MFFSDLADFCSGQQKRGVPVVSRHGRIARVKMSFGRGFGRVSVGKTFVGAIRQGALSNSTCRCRGPLLGRLCPSPCPKFSPTYGTGGFTVTTQIGAPTVAGFLDIGVPNKAVDWGRLKVCSPIHSNSDKYRTRNQATNSKRLLAVLSGRNPLTATAACSHK